MATYDIETAYNMLMSPAPYAQSSSAAMLRNFGTAAQLMAGHLRDSGARASGAGDAGAATLEQTELHAKWFDAVASNSTTAADHLDALAAAGNQHQATAQTVYSNYQLALQYDSGPNPSGSDDMNVIHQMQNGSRTLSAAVEEWGSSYSSVKLPAPPPAPSASGTSGAATGSSGGTSYTGGSTGGSSYTGGSSPSGSHHSGTTTLVATPVIDRGPGVPGSVEVGTDGGQFAGWYRDPRTGYYIDPGTGREFDPVSNRWVDPVTGLPFGEVTQYATGLQGLGTASTTGGLLADTTAAVGTGTAGLAGAGGFSGLLSGGNTTAVAGFYGGMLPPSLSGASAASGSLWRQAGQSLAVKQEVAASLVAREQAVRAGRSYLPPMQAGLGAGAGAGGRARPGYLTADEEEAGLFSSRTGRRAYLPPTQAGGKDEKSKRSAQRPDWLVDEDVFGADPAPSGVLGDD